MGSSLAGLLPFRGGWPGRWQPGRHEGAEGLLVLSCCWTSSPQLERCVHCCSGSSVEPSTWTPHSLQVAGLLPVSTPSPFMSVSVLSTCSPHALPSCSSLGRTQGSLSTFYEAKMTSLWPVRKGCSLHSPPRPSSLSNFDFFGVISPITF